MTGINDSGEVTGYGTVKSHTKSFIFDAQGNNDIFQVGGAEGTMAMAINALGTVAGGYFFGRVDGDNKGFVRLPSGTITTFKGEGGMSIFALSINGTGEIAGYAATPRGYNGFYRPNGGFPSFFDDPDAGISQLEGTVARKINSLGRITGYYYDTNGQVHAFVRNVLPPN